MTFSVAIVAIARLENQYINEWISYHRSIGFDHFYIYDNSFGNEPRLETAIAQDNARATTIVPAYDKVAFQKSAYNDAYTRFNELHDYMLFIDIDEFFTLMQHSNVSEYIQFLNSKCLGFQSARIHWEIYDDNNAVERDVSVPVHEFFTHASEEPYSIASNSSTKCLVKTRCPGMYFDNVHFSRSKVAPLITCNGSGQRICPVNQMVAERSVEYAKIRHYVTKTISEYMYQKLCRGDADGYIVRNTKNRFFCYCSKTPEKIRYYEQHKNDVYDGKYSDGQGNQEKEFNEMSFRHKKDRIVVTMTSWAKRIMNCRIVLDSVLNQTMKPNMVFLNLSLEEFPNRELDLPADLVQLSKTHPELKINWLSGNDKQFKKLFPILPLLDDDDIIMTVDDDFILNRNLIYNRYRDFNFANRSSVIVSDWMDCSQTMMFQKKMLLGYEMFATPEVIGTGNDDAVYFNIFYLNGYGVRKASCIFMSDNTIMYDGLGLTDNQQYLHPPEVTKIMSKIISQRFEGDWNDLFGVFRRMDLKHQFFVSKKPLTKVEKFMKSRFDQQFQKLATQKLYGDNLSIDTHVVFTGSDFSGIDGRDLVVCGAGWSQHLDGAFKKMHAVFPPQNFKCVRGKLSKMCIRFSGINISNNVSIGDGRILASTIVGSSYRGSENHVSDILLVVNSSTSESECNEYACLLNDSFGQSRKKVMSIMESDENVSIVDLLESIQGSEVVVSNQMSAIVFAHSFGVPAVPFSKNNEYELADYYSAYRQKLPYKLGEFKDALAVLKDEKLLGSSVPNREEIEKARKSVAASLPFSECLTEFGKSIAGQK